MKKNHDFHVLDPSPWPLLSAFSAFGLLFSLGLALHVELYFLPVMVIFLISVLGIAIFWWKDVLKEAVFDNAHTFLVQKGLKIGMLVFIFSEVMFFASFFWSFFKAWLDPVNIIEVANVVGKVKWPPDGIEVVDPWNIPLLNTLILLLSSSAVSWAHHSVLAGDNRSMAKGLSIAVLLGLFFTILQGYEYYHASFSFIEEGEKAVYATNFYMATGFHGAHVLIGTIFLSVCMFRALNGKYSTQNHIGFECAAWYWHFVDAVWLCLFAFLYVLSR